MKRIFYSKSINARIAFTQEYFLSMQPSIKKIVYLAPKKFIPDITPRLQDITILAFEDITKKNDVFNLATDDTLLVFDRVSRYKNITTDTFVRLSRASNQYKYKILVDIVPFTADVQFLYCPLALIDRGILGYQHWYSYRENNAEINMQGERVQSHDYLLLAQKMRERITIDYQSFLGNNIHYIECSLTNDEKQQYQELRDTLFAENKTASPIVTTLADWTNIREKRYQLLKELLKITMGNTVIYTNLASHNRRIKKAISEYADVDVKSFYDSNGEESRYDNVILFELPITKSYLFLDVIANIRDDCNIHIFRSDTTVDKLLFNHMNTELQGLNEFTQILYKEVNSETWSETLLTAECS